jgi:enoyl-CoA hydratase/3-hydroxyacyl-CoA dehydrogenase
MKIEEIDTVCFIGAGTMGCFNSLMAAVAGYKAVVYDRSEDALEQMAVAQQELADFLVATGFFTGAEIPEALRRITVSSDLHKAVANADLVSESVSERLDVKRQVHKLLDEVCRPDTLITTNTSSLKVSDIEDVLVRGGRFAALHSHLSSRLIDIVGGPRTAPATIELLKRYVLSIDGVPLLLKKENPGYVLNALLGPLLTMAMILVIEGISSKEDVDRAWMLNRKVAIGPFGLMDFFGLNIIADSWQDPRPGAEELKDKILGFLGPYIERNALGAKTGEGFYSYPDQGYSQEGFLSTDVDLSFPYLAQITVLIENAIIIARKDVADIGDIDRAWMVTMSVDIGPFGMLDEMGIDTFLAAYAGLVELGLFSNETAETVKDFLQPYVDGKALGEKTAKGFYNYPNPLFKTLDFLQIEP